MVKLDRKSHTYKKGRIKYTPVSDVLKAYRVPFDAEHWSSYKAYKEIFGQDLFKDLAKGYNPKDPNLLKKLRQLVDKKELEMVKNRILAEWEKNSTKLANKGTRYHRSKELLSYNRGYEISPFTGEKIETIGKTFFEGKSKTTKTDLYSLPDGYYPELIIWNDEFRIAGTPDKVFISTESTNRYVDLDDYKAVKEIDTFNRHQKFLPPLSHLDDCRYHRYRLQVTMYGWMLQEFGYTIRHTAFTHLNQQYKFDFNESVKDIELILNDLKN